MRSKRERRIQIGSKRERRVMKTERERREGIEEEKAGPTTTTSNSLV